MSARRGRYYTQKRAQPPSACVHHLPARRLSHPELNRASSPHLQCCRMRARGLGHASPLSPTRDGWRAAQRASSLVNQRCSCCNCCAAGPNHQPPLASSPTARQQHAHSLPSLLDTYVTRQQCKAWLEVRVRVARAGLHVRVTRPSFPHVVWINRAIDTN